MKKNISTFNELLKNLAQNGDASAFFSLSESYFLANYQKERNNNVAHTDAASKVIAEATELFEQFVQLSPNQFDVWFEEHCTFHPSSNNEHEEVILDKKTIAESNRFITQCAQELIRTGSVLKKNKQTKMRAFPRILFRRQILIPVGIPLLLGLILGSTLLLLNAFQTIVIITILSPAQKYSIQFPPYHINDSLVNKNVALSRKNDTLKMVPDSTKKTVDTTNLTTAKSPAPPIVQKRVPLPPVVEKRTLPPVSRPTAYTPPQSPAPTYSPPAVTPAPQSRTEEVASPPTPEPAALPPTPSATGSASDTSNNSY